MSQINIEIYDAFKEAGVSDETARAAATPSSDMVTKADLKAELKDLELRLTWRLITAMGVQTAVIGMLLVILGN